MTKTYPVGMETPRRARIVRTLAALSATMALAGALRAVDPVPAVPGTWTLQFQDEFTGSALDGAKWRLGGHFGGIAGSGANSPTNVSVADGKLKIKAEQRAATYCGTSYSYAAGEVSTFFNYRQQYGYMEARIKYPAVTGLWPAFWMMPDRASYGWKDNYRRAYLKFDLTGAGLSSVTSATLKLKVSGFESGGTNNLVLMKLADDSWSESTINWNNKPAPDPLWLGQKWNNTAIAVGSEVTFDVTSYVAQQVAGDKKVGFVLADGFLRTKLISFYSREAANAADRPRLVINGVEYVATEDATVRWGTLAGTNYGSSGQIDVRDDWGDTATTYSGGMEIDIMESLGIWGADTLQHALHWDGYAADHKSIGWPGVDALPSSDGFHTYGVYWESGLLAFYVDGIKTAEYANSRVSNVPAYFLLSLQIGGWDNNNPGAQVNNQVMEVDWVRAWSGTRSAPVTVTVDNADAGATQTGTWTASSTTGGYNGSNYLHDGNTGKGSKSVAFRPALLADGDYLVYARWTSDTNRATNVPFDITLPDGTVSTVTVNQQLNGGAWRLLGVYDLAVMNAKAVVRTTGTAGYVVADAVRFVPVPSAGAIEVDNTTSAYVASTGAWTSSTSTPGYLGTDYVNDGNAGKGTKTFSFKPAVSSTGSYLVYARWTSGTNRASNVPVDIVTSSGAVSTVTVNQTVNGGEWNPLGVFTLAPANAEVKIRTTGTNGYVIADGVRVVPVAAQ